MKPISHPISSGLSSESILADTGTTSDPISHHFVPWSSGEMGGNLGDMFYFLCVAEFHPKPLRGRAVGAYCQFPKKNQARWSWDRRMDNDQMWLQLQDKHEFPQQMVFMGTEFTGDVFKMSKLPEG